MMDNFKFYLIAVLAAAVIAPGWSHAQQKALGHDVYDGWQSVSGVSLTPDGSFLTYSVNVQEGDGELHLRRMSDGKEVVIPRGYSVRTDPEGRYAWCLVRPLFEQTRQAKIRKEKQDRMPKDSVAVVRLADLSVEKYPGAKSLGTGHDRMPFAAYSYDKGVVVLNPSARKVDTLRHASSFVFSRSGDALAVVFKKDKKDSLSSDKLMILRPGAGESETVSEGAAFYSLPSFSSDGKSFVFLSSADTVREGGNRHCALNIYSEGRLREVLPAGWKHENGWSLNENSDPFFSHGGGRIFVGIAPFRPPKDSSIVDFETALVDIWNWDALRTPPQQRIQQKRILEKTYQAVVDLADGGLTLLTDSEFDSIRLVGGGDGDWALSLDDTPYMLSRTWDMNDRTDVSLVNLGDGSRTLLAEGLPGHPQLSPGGRFLIWFDSEYLQWFTYEIATGRTVCLTENCGVAFYDEEDDHPTAPDAYDSPYWTEDDSFVLICDRYDVWRFSPAGGLAECLTAGAGREAGVQLRKLHPADKGLTSTDRRLGLADALSDGEELWLSAFDEGSKRNGLAMIRSLRAARPAFFTDTLSFPAFVKARDAAVYAFEKGNFRSPNDLWTASELTRRGKPAARTSMTAEQLVGSALKVTAINPQQEAYRWGEARLVHWDAFDGTPLDGILYVPDGTKDTDSLPMIIYYYEKYSETLYSYKAPAPSRSIVNIPWFVSNGYVIFVPDIVYEPGHPGESAYNCVVSGAEAMCCQFPFINREKMGIQGQSWGGYQTAWLITRTDIFAAAGAGAPVGNMTSAYGGIRWESGNVRAMQYEHGQSRIGKSLWDEGGLDLYIENSPIFNADKITTPVLIMHNDADGAVPWYQGIEFFSDLRRHGARAWLLQYNDEAHNLLQRRNCKDLSVRLGQFFGHFLKDEPMPVWMKYGVPVWQKDRYQGFEPAQ